LAGQALGPDLRRRCDRFLQQCGGLRLILLDGVHGHSWAIRIGSRFHEMSATIVTILTTRIGPACSDLA
jgi:hypothetical protein